MPTKIISDEIYGDASFSLDTKSPQIAKSSIAEEIESLGIPENTSEVPKFIIALTGLLVVGLFIGSFWGVFTTNRIAQAPGPVASLSRQNAQSSATFLAANGQAQTNKTLAASSNNPVPTNQNPNSSLSGANPLQIFIRDGNTGNFWVVDYQPNASQKTVQANQPFTSASIGSSAQNTSGLCETSPNSVSDPKTSLPSNDNNQVQTNSNNQAVPTNPAQPNSSNIIEAQLSKQNTQSSSSDVAESGVVELATDSLKVF